MIDNDYCGMGTVRLTPIDYKHQFYLDTVGYHLIWSFRDGDGNEVVKSRFKLERIE